MAVLNGEAYWACILAPNTKFPDHYWGVELVVSRETAEDFKKRGFRIKELEPGPALTIKRKVNWTDKTGAIHTRNGPALYDKQKQPLDCQVGNGSKVRVQYKEWQSGQWQGLDLIAMQVLDLVEYNNSSAGSEFDVEEAFDNEEDEL